VKGASTNSAEARFLIVVISDLHLNDEGNRTISPRAFEIFRDRVISAAMKIKWGSRNSKGAIAATDRFVDIILNGDILDYIRSELWQQSEERPWDLPDKYPSILSRINDGILQKNKKSLGILKSLVTRTGLPKDFPDDVGFRIHYLVGNHDWFLVLPPSKEINAIRKKVASAIGLHPGTNPVDGPFPHDPLTDACDDLKESMRRHRVFVRHGDIHDRMNFPGTRGQASIGDAIVIEILGAIAPKTDAKLAGNVREDTRRLTNSYLREIDNLRPYSTLPRWLESLIATLEGSPEFRDEAPQVTRAINDTFKELAKNFRNVGFVKSYTGLQERLKAKLPTYVSDWLGIRLPALQEAVMAFAMGQGSKTIKYATAAYEEQWLRQGIVDTIVYGHTHTPAVVPLDMVHMPLDGEDDAREWTYVNSGTWRPVQQRCLVQERQNEFSFSHTMTHVMFYTPRERKDHTIDFWTGSLSDIHFPVRADRDMLMLDGRLISQDTKTPDGLPGKPTDYRVVLYDVDLARHDLLGSVIPGPDWRFTFGFFQSQFHELGEGSTPEPRIEVYRDGELIASVLADWPRYAGNRADVGDISL